MACKLYYAALHTQTNTKERQPFFAGIFNCKNFTINTPVSETWCYKQTVESLQFFIYILGCDEFAVNILHNHFTFIDCTGMNKCLKNGFVGIL